MAQRFILVPEAAADAVSKQMAEDLLVVTQLSVEQLETLAKRVAESKGFLNRTELLDLTNSISGDDRKANSLVRVLLNLTPDAVEQTIASIQKWRSQKPENDRYFSTAAFQSLQERLPQLICDYPAIDRYRKAIHLQTVLGSRVQGVEVICDLRPVFDEAREKIEGLIPITTLKVSFTEQNEEIRVVEALLEGDLLRELSEKLEYARKKLAVMENSIDLWLEGGFVKLD